VRKGRRAYEQPPKHNTFNTISKGQAMRERDGRLKRLEIPGRSQLPYGFFFSLKKERKIQKFLGTFLVALVRRP
jgi:hypothetical protein